MIFKQEPVTSKGAAVRKLGDAYMVLETENNEEVSNREMGQAYFVADPPPSDTAQLIFVPNDSPNIKLSVTKTTLVRWVSVKSLPEENILKRFNPIPSGGKVFFEEMDMHLSIERPDWLN